MILDTVYVTENLKLLQTEEKTISVSLRKTNSVNYAPMLDSASEESDEP